MSVEESKPSCLPASSKGKNIPHFHTNCPRLNHLANLVHFLPGHHLARFTYARSRSALIRVHRQSGSLARKCGCWRCHHPGLLSVIHGLNGPHHHSRLGSPSHVDGRPKAKNPNRVAPETERRCVALSVAASESSVSETVPSIGKRSTDAFHPAHKTSSEVIIIHQYISVEVSKGE